MRIYKQRIFKAMLLICLIFICFRAGVAHAVEYSAWSDWQTSQPEIKAERQIETREVVTGYNVASFLYQKNYSPYDRIYYAYNIGDQYEAYGFRRSYGCHPRYAVLTKEQIETATQLASGTWMGEPDNVKGWIGGGTAYRVNGGWEPWYIQSEIKQTQYRYRDKITDPITEALNTDISVDLSCKADGIALSWNRVSNVTGYAIYRDGTRIARLNGSSVTSYRDKTAKTNGTKYTYRVRCYISIDGVIKYGVKSKSKDITYLTRVSTPTDSALNGGMKITWSKNSKCTGYEVYYSTNSGFSGAKCVKIADKNTLSVTIKNLKSVKYYIRIRCYINVNGVVTYSTWSPVQTCTPKAPLYTYSGRITDASTGKKLGDATLNIRKGSNNKSGTIYRTTETDSDGCYKLRLPKGDYTMQVQKSGYITIYINIDVTVNITVEQNTPISISKKLDSGEYRAVLTWGASPRDLDSHLAGTGSFGSFHSYFNNQIIKLDGKKQAQLDIDDTSSYGPETITFRVRSGAKYSYYVHQYSTDGGLLGTSNAVVRVYKGNSLIATYKVPNRTGNSWHVFSVRDNKLIAKNTMTTIPEGAYTNYTVQ